MEKTLKLFTKMLKFFTALFIILERPT